MNGSSSGCIIESNNLSTSTAATKIQNLGAGNYVRGNPGFVTKATGTVAVSAASTAVVTHGLSVTPTVAQIQVWCGSALSGVTQLYVDTITSTQFTVHLNASSTGTIAWAVDTEI